MASRGLSLQRLKPLVSRPSINEPKSAKQESHRNSSQIKLKSTDSEKQKEPGKAKLAATTKQTTKNVIHGSEQLGLSI